MKDPKYSKNNIKKKRNQRLKYQGENCYKMFQNDQNDRYWQTNRSTLGQIVSGTKWDRDKLIFCRKRGSV